MMCTRSWTSIDNDDYLSLSTFVHEWGHGVHTLLTDDAQPFEKSNYSTFTAETASITNEMLLSDYMVAHATSDAQKLYYLGEALELMRATFFRQTMFAEFQLAIHEELEAGKALSGTRMSEIYCGLLKKYHGDAQGVMTIDPSYCDEWEFIRTSITASMFGSMRRRSPAPPPLRTPSSMRASRRRNASSRC